MITSGIDEPFFHIRCVPSLPLLISVDHFSILVEALELLSVLPALRKQSRKSCCLLLSIQLEIRTCHFKHALIGKNRRSRHRPLLLVVYEWQYYLDYCLSSIPTVVVSVDPVPGFKMVGRDRAKKVEQGKQ